MTKLRKTVARSATVLFFVFGMMSQPALGADLSKYRNFRLGMDLPAVASLSGQDTSQAQEIHHRPALIQELDWFPQPLSSSQTESVQELIFGFYDGKLFRVAVNYDRYETEGLTAADLIEAISAEYGVAEKPEPPDNTMPGRYGDQDEIVARWQDSQYCFDLVRSSYGPTFRLIGVVKKLQVSAQAAASEAKRLDDREAPQREAARIVDQKEIQQAKLEKSRLVNKPKFRP